MLPLQIHLIPLRLHGSLSSGCSVCVIDREIILPCLIIHLLVCPVSRDISLLRSHPLELPTDVNVLSVSAILEGAARRTVDFKESTVTTVTLASGVLG